MRTSTILFLCWKASCLPAGLNTVAAPVSDLLNRTFPVVGFRIRGVWAGLRLAPEQLSDMTIELGHWLTEYVASVAAQHDDEDDQ